MSQPPDHSQDFRRELPNNVLDFTRAGSHLVISFDNAGSPHREPPDRRPWGFNFFSRNGYSILGVIAKQSDWYRCPVLHAELSEMRDRGFFASFERVSLAGSSMGGYAAAAFSSLAPGATVVAYNPQSTLRADLVPFETGHANGRAQDWTGLFVDGAVESRTASKIYLFYDPYHTCDRKHADRFDNPNTVRLLSYHLDHGLPISYLKMGVLKDLMKPAVDGTLTPEEFRRIIPGRKDVEIYHRTMFEMMVRLGHVEWARAHAFKGIQRFGSNYFMLRAALLDAHCGALPQALTMIQRFEAKIRADAKQRARRIRASAGK